MIFNDLDFVTFSVDKNSAANLVIGTGLEGLNKCSG